MDNRRRNYFINASYQGQFIFVFIFTSVAGIMAAALATVRYLNSGFEENLYRSHYKIGHVSDIVLPVTVKVNLLFTALGVLAIALLSYYYYKRAERLSERVVHTFTRFRQGHINFAVEIGQKREFPHLERLLDFMLATNRAHLRVARRLAHELEESSIGLYKAAKEGRDIKSHAKRAAIKASELERLMGSFKTDS